MTVLFRLAAVISYIAQAQGEEEEEAPGTGIPEPTADASGFPLQDAVETLLNVLMWLGFAASIGGVIAGGAILAVAHVTSNSMWGSKGKVMALLALLGGMVVATARQLVIWVSGL